MISNIRFIFTLTVLSIFTAGMIYHNSVMKPAMETHNVKIEKDNDGTWRVRDNNGKNKGYMDVSEGDQIFWQAKGSDMVFIFSKEIGDYFEFDEGFFADGKSQRIKKSKKLRVTVKEGAPRGDLIYEVYVLKDDKTVIGNSPPKLIIR